MKQQRQMRDVWQQADTLIAPLSERPLWCVAAGLLVAACSGPRFDLPLAPLSGALLLAGCFLILPGPYRRCSAAVVWPGGSGSDFAYKLAWFIHALPPHHIARVLPSLPRHVTVEGTLDARLTLA